MLRASGRLGVALALAAGAVDAIGVIVLRGLFTAHMSGNTARLGLRLGRGTTAIAVPVAVAIVLFVAGIACASALAEALSRRGRTPARWLLSLEGALLAAFAVTGGASGLPAQQSGVLFYALLALAVVAIGLQTAALPRISGQRIRTTYISGTLTYLAQELVAAVATPRPGRYLDAALGLDDRAEARGRALLHAAVAFAYLGGAAGGAFAAVRIDAWAAALPAAVVTCAALPAGRR
jgi:uncharacterized membrane protein YoaK (UPF0700 family)